MPGSDTVAAGERKYMGASGRRRTSGAPGAVYPLQLTITSSNEAADKRSVPIVDGGAHG